MSYADAIRRQAEDAPRAALPAVTKALWQAFADGHVSEAEAETLSGLIEMRHAKGVHNADTRQDRQSSPRRPGDGSRPRTDASMERRRRWAASGRLPPGLAARFTLAEQSVLALVAAETTRRGDCRLAIEHVAAIAGVSRSTVKTAIREARKLGLVTVEERRVTGFRNLPNIVRIVSPEWTAWLRLARRGDPLSNERGVAAPSLSQGGGVKCSTRTPTEVLVLCESRPAEAKKGCRAAAVDPGRSDPTRIRAGGGASRAMR